MSWSVHDITNGDSGDESDGDEVRCTRACLTVRIAIAHHPLVHPGAFIVGIIEHDYIA